jgi:hypothetical protein
MFTQQSVGYEALGAASIHLAIRLQCPNWRDNWQYVCSEAMSSIGIPF